MTWTFDDTDLSTDLARVRLTIGDTNTNDQGLTDEVIAYFLDDVGDDIIHGSLQAARALRAKWQRDIDRNNLGVSSPRSQKVQHLNDTISELEQRLSYKGTPFLGGVSDDRAASLESDTDFPTPAFRRDDFDNKDA